MESPEEKLHRDIFSQKFELDEDIPAPKVQENIDWSNVISTVQDQVKDVEEGTYFDEEDSKQYVWEAVMEAMYGKDFFKWFNKNI